MVDDSQLFSGTVDRDKQVISGPAYAHVSKAQSDKPHLVDRARIGKLIDRIIGITDAEEIGVPSSTTVQRIIAAKTVNRIRCGCPVQSLSSNCAGDSGGRLDCRAISDRTVCKYQLFDTPVHAIKVIRILVVRPPDDA